MTTPGAPRSSGPRVGRPARTSRAEILVAARHLIDQDGWERLTMRRLADEVGVAATTLYHHVPDKERLLVALLGDYADRVDRPPLPREPKERIVAAATTMHDALAAWPWAVEVLTADDVIGESALWMVEAVVGAAVDHGYRPEEAVDVYRAIWYFTVGEILVRARSARRRAVDDRPTHRDTVFSDLDATRLPHLAGLAERWPALSARDIYATGLRALVDGLLPPR